MKWLEHLRNRWTSYIFLISANREPGYIGNTPYLLILRALAILAVILRFLFPFSRWTGLGGINVIIPIIILALIAEWVVLWRITKLPYQPSRHNNRVIAAMAIFEVVLITIVCAGTGLPTSDFSLFYYLPILTSAEFLRLKYVPFVAGSVYLGLATLLLYFYKPGIHGAPGNGWDLVIIGIMRGGFLFTVIVMSVLLTRLQRSQNELLTQNTKINRLLSVHRLTGEVFDVKAILDATIGAVKGMTAVAKAGALLTDPGCFDLDSGLIGVEALEAPQRELLCALAEQCAGSAQLETASVGERALMTAPIRTYNTFRGVLFALGAVAQFPAESDEYLSSVAEIANVGLSRAKAVSIFQEIGRAAFGASTNDAVIEWLLQNLTEEYGFDFAAVSAVDPFQKTISMLRARNVEPGWLDRTSYPLDHPDILTDIVSKAAREVEEGRDGSGAAECIAGYDPRFDPGTYELYGHSKLVRIFAPMLDSGRVVGVLEVGCAKERESEVRQNLSYVVGMAQVMGCTLSAIQPNEFLAGVSHRVMELVGAHSATIHIYDDQGGVAREASAGLATKQDFIKRFKPHVPPGREGIGAKARRTGEVVIVDDESEVENQYPEMHTIGVRAMAAFPLSLMDRRDGVLYLHFFECPHRFTQAEVAVASSAVKLIESAILTRDFLDEIARSAKWGWMVAGQHPVVQSLTRSGSLAEVLQNLVRKLRVMFGATSVVLYCYDEVKDSFPEVFSDGVSTSALKDPPRNTAPYQLLQIFRETQFFADAERGWARLLPGDFVEKEEIVSCAAVILRANRDSEVVGVMFVNYRNRQKFLGDIRPAIVSLGESAAIAIGTARLHDQANRELAGWLGESRAFNEINNLIAQSVQNPKRDEVLRLILTHSLKLTNATDGTLFLLEADQQLTPLFWEGFEGVDVGPQRLGEGIVGEAAQGCRAIRVDDVRNYPRYLRAKASTRSELAVPLRYQDEVLGVINLEHPHEEFFNENHANWLEALAMQGVIAIRSIESFHQLETASRAIEAVAGRLQRTPPPDLSAARRLVLTGVTAKQGLAFTRSMLFEIDRDEVAGSLAVGPYDGGEAAADWAGIDAWERQHTAPIGLDQVLDAAEQFEREVAIGSPIRMLDSRARDARWKLEGNQPWFVELAAIKAELVVEYDPHPARRLLERVIAPEDVNKEFAVVPLREGTEDRVVGILLADRAYQARARPIQNVDLRHLEVFGRLAMLALQNDRLRGKLGDNQRQQEWDQFVRTTMHGITTAIGSAESSLGWLRKELEDLNASPKLKPDLDRIRQCHSRAKEIAEAVSDYTRPLGTLKKMDLPVLVKRVILGDRTISFKDACDTAALAAVSEVRLKDALSAVIRNAQEAAEEKQVKVEIWIELRRVQEPGREMFRLEIRDNAGGMPVGMAEQILAGHYSRLTEFVRNGVKKHGLGLPIARKVLILHGGRLDIQPIPDGTSILMYLPALNVLKENG